MGGGDRGQRCHPNFLNETQWLDYFWPLFRISGTVYGMNDLYNTSYKENKKATDDEFLQPKFGDACRVRRVRRMGGADGTTI